MTSFILKTLCVLVAVAVPSRTESIEKYGADMAANAYDIVCWYVNAKVFPDTNSKVFTNCQGYAKTQLESLIKANQDIKQDYAMWMTGDGYPMSRLPSQYDQQCTPYLQNPDQAPPADMSAILNDGSTGPYPFQGYAYCMLNVLKNDHGDKALKAAQNEITVSRMHWKDVILQRDNEFRSRHGSEPFHRVKDLDDQAQEWADKMAAECSLYHSDNSYAGRQWRGDGTGESIASGPGGPGGTEGPQEYAAYTASDGWYEESKKYPFPEGYNGDGTDQLFKNIGHFTQTVWRDSKYVGYGYAFNPSCGSQKWYIAGRYAKPGNYKGQYQANVLPPQN